MRVPVAPVNETLPSLACAIERGAAPRAASSPSPAGLRRLGSRLHNPPPMRELRLGLAQVNATVGDLDGNFQKILEYLERARALGVEVLVFPEMVITGYPPEDLLLKPSFIDTAIQCTRDLMPHTRGMTLIVGTVDRDV